MACGVHHFVACFLVPLPPPFGIRDTVGCTLAQTEIFSPCVSGWGLDLIIHLCFYHLVLMNLTAYNIISMCFYVF